MNETFLPFSNASLEKQYCDWVGWKTVIPVENLLEKAKEIHENNGELLTLWGTDERVSGKGFCVHIVFVFWTQGTLYIQCHLPENDPGYPDMSLLFPVANRLQRALYDLLGVKAMGSEDTRPWLQHHAWPKDIFPLRHDVNLKNHFPPQADNYPFIHVTGEGVHEIPVGPVHAGIIEPGHFRFHVVGEHVLRLEERLGYTHKGIAKHFQHASLMKGARIAGRISGDSTVAYAWAYAMALENLHHHTVPPRAQWLRALLLERERLANHLGDLGALGNDAGLNFALNQFSRLKENVLRVNATIFKHRYLMDTIIPGGVCANLIPENHITLQIEIQTLRKEVDTLFLIYQEHGGLQDRFMTTGIITPELAKKLGILGFAARASARPIDWRKQMTYAPYHPLNMACPIEHTGDVAARVLMRFKEITASLKAMETILQHLPEGEISLSLPSLSSSQVGIGCVEGWRGPVFIALSAQDNEHLLWVHAHDPSWQNWPALEYAVMGNIVPDFPLINKSFNLSYSGHDG